MPYGMLCSCSMHVWGTHTLYYSGAGIKGAWSICVSRALARQQHPSSCKCQLIGKGHGVMCQCRSNLPALCALLLSCCSNMSCAAPSL